MNLQKSYELDVAQQKIGDNLKARKPMIEMPLPRQ
jgi:hypothetical protein